MAELGVSIHDQVLLSAEKAVVYIRQISRDLLHPSLMGTRCASSEVNPASLEFHHKQQIERDEPSRCPDFDCGKVNGGEDVPMSLNERLPRCFPLTRGCRFDAVLFEYISYRFIADGMTYILNCSRDPIVAPRRILSSESDHQFPHFVGQWRPSRFLFSPLTVIPFICDQLSMPTQNRIGCE